MDGDILWRRADNDVLQQAERIPMTAELEHLIIGTAGHIDHGKTALVKALTGYDTDTLSEEKKRGITIELGFAFLQPEGVDKQIVFIDVPGHEKLVRTMVAGASNIDAVLLVIAADEGTMPQTREHFEVLQLLGIPGGIIAVTKTDLVDEETLAVAIDKIRESFSGTFLENAPIIKVSSITGAGIDDLKSELVKICNNSIKRNDSGIFRMPIDRVFTMKGFGTVIAGTDLSGKVSVGDTIEIYPERIKAKIRGVQIHHHKAAESAPGRRTALNLQNVEKSALRRGQTAAAPGSLTVTERLDATLQILPGAKKELKNRARVRLHVNTDEIIARVIILESDTITPGQEGFVQFALERPAVAVRGDRFVIRTFSPIITIGGGKILDPCPDRHKRFDQSQLKSLQAFSGDDMTAIEQFLLGHGFSPSSLDKIATAMGADTESTGELLDQLTQQDRVIGIETKSGTVYLHKNSFEELKQKIQEAIRNFLQQNRYRKYAGYSSIRSAFVRDTGPDIFEAALKDLVREKAIEKLPGKLGLSGYKPPLTPDEESLMQSILDTYEQSGYSSPSESDACDQLGASQQNFKNIMALLIDSEELVRLNDKVTYHRGQYRQIKEFVIEHIRKNGSINVKTLRDLLGVSRKYALAILEHFDDIALTKRIEDHRVLA
jgi:selenocysteine-specific elongation factor